MLHTRNNTDGNKLVIFSGIASYYGDNYIISILIFIKWEVVTSKYMYIYTYGAM